MAQALAYHADDPQADKLLLVMEYAEAGPVMRGDRSTEKVPLAEGVALKFFRDVLQVSLHSCATTPGFFKVSYVCTFPFSNDQCRYKAHT